VLPWHLHRLWDGTMSTLHLHWISATMLVLVLGARPGTAYANDELDRGLSALEEARFEDASAAFSAALEGQLSRAELLALVEGRALLHFALHAADDLDSDLRWLAALDPGHVFDPSRPPDLARLFASVQQQHPDGVGIEATALPVGGELRIHAAVEHPVEDMSLVRRTCARQPGAAWRCVNDGDLDLPSSGDVNYYAELIGPGGAVVASAGSAVEPLHFEAAAPSASPGSTTSSASSEASAPILTPSSPEAPPRGHGLVIGLSVGGAVVAIATAVALVLVLRGDDAIHVRAPVVR